MTSTSRRLVLWIWKRESSTRQNKEETKRWEVAGIVDRPGSCLHSSTRDYCRRKGLLDVEFIEWWQFWQKQAGLKTLVIIKKAQVANLRLFWGCMRVFANVWYWNFLYSAVVENGSWLNLNLIPLYLFREENVHYSRIKWSRKDHFVLHDLAWDIWMWGIRKCRRNCKRHFSLSTR